MLFILIRTLLLYLFLNIILRAMGKRQIGELEVSEMISTFLLSEIIAMPIADTSLPLLSGILPALFIFGCEIFISSAKNHSAKLKKLLEGSPVYIIYKGRLRQNALTENRISLNEFLSSLRALGVFAHDTVEYAILEPNGKMSVLLKENAQPLTVGGEDGGMAHSLVIDGEIQRKSLSLLGWDEEMLLKEFRERGIALEHVFLFTIDDAGRQCLIEKELT